MEKKGTHVEIIKTIASNYGLKCEILSNGIEEFNAIMEHRLKNPEESSSSGSTLFTASLSIYQDILLKTLIEKNLYY